MHLCRARRTHRTLSGIAHRRRLAPLRMAIMAGCTALTLSILPHAVAFAGRPLATEDAATVGRRTFEVELGSDFTRMRGDGSDAASMVLVPVIGIADPLDISCEIPMAMLAHKDQTHAYGISDISIAAKGLLLKEKGSRPALSLKTMLTLPTGNTDKGLGGGSTNVGLVLAATKTIGNTSIHGNVGYVFARGGDMNNFLVYGLAAEFELTDRWRVAAEVYAESDTVRELGAWRSHTYNPLAGIAFRAWENGSIDIGMRVGLTVEEGIVNYGPLAGVSFSF